MDVYTVNVIRSDNWWALDVLDVGIRTQTRRLDKAEGTARDAIALLLDVEPDTFVVKVNPPVLPPRVQAAIARSARSKHAAVATASRATADMNAAVRAMTEAGMTVRDIGKVLNVSYQRVAQVAQRLPSHSDVA